jgi:tetratricopeptide (TPR) repeat protein
VDDNACVADMSDKLVAHYPKPEYWTNVISTLLQSEGGDKQTLNVLRLGSAADVLKPGQYTELAQLAIDQGLPGEAQIALEKAATKNPDAQTKERNARLLETAKKAAALDKTTLDAQDARAKAKPTGDADVKLGAAYLSYNEPQKAIEALKRGIGKGKLKDPDEAAILLGIAYSQVNNKEEAAKAFNTVAGTPVMTRIAKLWVTKNT